MASNGLEELPPGLLDFLHLLRHDFLMSTLLESMMNGIYTTIIALTIFSLVQKGGLRSLCRPFVGVILLLYALAVIHVALRWSLVREAFITHGESEATTLMYMMNLPMRNSLTSATVFTLSTLIADSILVWRCWLVFNRRVFPAIIPSLTTLGGFAVGIYVIVIESDPEIQKSVSREALTNATTSQNALNLATTVIATAFIVYRIIASQQLEGNAYRRIIEIIVESAAIYSIVIIVHMPFLLLDGVTNALPLAVLAQVTGIAPTLIVVRVALGYSRPDSTWAGSGPIGTLDFQAEGKSTFGGTLDTYRNHSGTMIEDEEKTANIEDGNGAIR